MKVPRSNKAALVGALAAGVLAIGGVALASPGTTPTTPIQLTAVSRSSPTATNSVIQQDLANLKAARVTLRAAKQAERKAMRQLRMDRTKLRRDRHRLVTSGNPTPTPSASATA